MAILLCVLLAVAVARPNGASAATFRSTPTPASSTTSVAPAPGGGATTTTASTTSPSTTTSTTSPTTTTVPPPTTTVARPGSAPTTATTGSTTTTTAATTTTTLDPEALANLIVGLDGDVAQAQAVDQYLAAKSVAAQITTGQPLPAGADPVLVQAAQAQLQANADQEAADQRFANAERGIGQVALNLYVDGNAAAGAGSALAQTADRSAFLTGVLDAEEIKAKAAKQALAQANVSIAQSRAQADQLVQSRTAQLQAIALQAAAGAVRAATTVPVPGQSGLGQSQAAPALPDAPATAGAPPPTIPSLLAAESPSILGPALLTADEITGWYRNSGRQANLTVPIDQLVADFISVGGSAGVRADVAFAQSMVETDYLDFPSWGQVTVSANNFAGIGACDSCARGYTFPDALTGVEAQMQLLHAYATTSQPFAGPLPGPFSVSGCCPTWMALSGVWATNLSYGVEILTTYRNMVEWALAERRAAAKL